MANPFNFFINPFKGLNKVVTTYTSGSGNWTCPAGVTSVYVECWGGGGGGGYVQGNAYGKALSGGGGGGAYAAGLVSVTPGNSYPYTVGAGGSGGKPSGNGGETTFNSTSIKAIPGGYGSPVVNKIDGSVHSGDYGMGGMSTYCTGTVKYSGGNGAKGYYYIENNVKHYLSAGGGAGADGDGDGDPADWNTATTYLGGSAGTKGGGAGGDGVVWPGGPGAAYAGSDGNEYGGGGGGAIAASSNNFAAGGNGANGAVRITYYL